MLCCGRRINKMQYMCADVSDSHKSAANAHSCISRWGRVDMLSAHLVSSKAAFENGSERQPLPWHTLSSSEEWFAMRQKQKASPLLLSFDSFIDLLQLNKCTYFMRLTTLMTLMCVWQTVVRKKFMGVEQSQSWNWEWRLKLKFGQNEFRRF